MQVLSNTHVKLLLCGTVFPNSEIDFFLCLSAQNKTYFPPNNIYCHKYANITHKISKILHLQRNTVRRQNN